MSEQNFTRIYDILDSIRKEVSEMNGRLSERTGQAESRLDLLERLQGDCRGEVIAMHGALRGNGKRGWFSRIEALEHAATMQSKWFWVAVLSVQGVLVATVSTIVARVL